MRFSRSVLLRKNTGLSGSGIACGTMPGVQTRGILSTVLVSRWQLPSSRVTGPMCPGMLQAELHHTSTLLLLGGGLLGAQSLPTSLRSACTLYCAMGRPSSVILPACEANAEGRARTANYKAGVARQRVSFKTDYM